MKKIILPIIFFIVFIQNIINAQINANIEGNMNSIHANIETTKGKILLNLEFEKMNKDELQIRLTDNIDALLNLRIQKALQQLEHPQKIRSMKREIAQIKTVIREYELRIRVDNK